jgi:fructose-1,6-bisphosphatase
MPTEDDRAEALYDTIADILTEHGVSCDTEAAEKIIEAVAKLCGDSYGEGYQTGVADAAIAHEHEMEEAIAGKADVEVDAEIVIPCMDGTENHKFVVSEENENVCYCERCGCIEY